MIDQPARRAAAALIDRFRTGSISFDELEVEWPSSSDAAVREISGELWSVFYSDLASVVFDASRRAPEEAILLDRCSAFLRTALPYKWPKRRRSVFRDLIQRLSATTDARQREKPAAHSEAEPAKDGDPSAWPFFRPEDVYRG